MLAKISEFSYDDRNGYHEAQNLIVESDSKIEIMRLSPKWFQTAQSWNGLYACFYYPIIKGEWYYRIESFEEAVSYLKKKRVKIHSSVYEALVYLRRLDEQRKIVEEERYRRNFEARKKEEYESTERYLRLWRSRMPQAEYIDGLDDDLLAETTFGNIYTVEQCAKTIKILEEKLRTMEEKYGF